MQGKLSSVLRNLRSGGKGLDAGEERMRHTREEVEADWRATADLLRKQGDDELAAQVDRFLARMPCIRTDARRMAEQWRALEKGREQMREDVKSPGAPVR
jgi:hypothetical protein